jgi:hypothetical protein
MNAEMRIEYVALDEVARWPGNPKKHDDETIDASIERFGFNDPLTVDEATGRLVEGHGRVDRLMARKADGKAPPARILVREDGKWLVPVVRGVSFTTEAEAEAYLLVHNRAAETGGWADDLLAEAFGRLRETDTEILGWDEDHVDEILREAADPDDGAQQQTQAEMLDNYVNADIKQICMYFDSVEYERTIRRMQVIMEARQIQSHTELILVLLDAYESTPH